MSTVRRSSKVSIAVPWAGRAPSALLLRLDRLGHGVRAGAGRGRAATQRAPIPEALRGAECIVGLVPLLRVCLRPDARSQLVGRAALSLRRLQRRGGSWARWVGLAARARWARWARWAGWVGWMSAERCACAFAAGAWRAGGVLAVAVRKPAACACEREWRAGRPRVQCTFTPPVSLTVEPQVNLGALRASELYCGPTASDSS